LAVSNGNSVAVFDFYSGARVADLRGHNARVRDMFWTLNDENIITCGQDGAVYVWDLEDSKRQGEFVHKGTMYLSVASVGSSVFAIGSDAMIKELELPELGVTREFEGGVSLAHLAVATTKVRDSVPLLRFAACVCVSD
jgi:WD40 repeat protein